MQLNNYTVCLALNSLTKYIEIWSKNINFKKMAVFIIMQAVNLRTYFIFLDVLFTTSNNEFWL